MGQKIKQRLIPWPIFVISLAILGCTRFCNKNHSAMLPEEVVETYLNIALNMQSPHEKSKLMEYTTGELEASLASASDETVIAAYIKPHYKVQKFSIVQRRDHTTRETSITYHLVYREIPNKEVKFEDVPQITTENTVGLVRDKGKWLISNVIGSKTSFDFPVSADSRITAPKP